MGKKIMNALTFLIVLGACIVMTVYIGKGSVSTMTYNFVFLGIMTVLYLAGLFMGMFRVDSIAQALKRGTEELAGIFQTPGKVKNDSLTHLQGIFDHKYLDDRMDSFINSMGNTQEGIGDVEEFINEDEIDLHVHKKLLEMVPDIFTSLGILGTFVGLVWGLKNFEPSSYETDDQFCGVSCGRYQGGISDFYLRNRSGYCVHFRNEEHLCGHERETPGISGKISCLCTSYSRK